jgi:hypothetical protein
MKNYIQYLDYDLSGKLSEPCGDRSIVVLDGRNSLETMIKDGIDFNGYRRPNYPHFRIMQGDLRSAKSIYSTVHNEAIGIYSGY